MDAKAAIAAAPLLRRAWRVVPGPLKLPLLVVGGAYALYRWSTGRREQTEAEAARHPLP